MGVVSESIMVKLPIADYTFFFWYFWKGDLEPNQGGFSGSQD